MRGGTDAGTPLMQTAERIARWLRIVAMLALVAMMLVVAVDVVMRVSMNRLLPGSVELVQLTLVIAVFLGIPETFLRNEQITIDLIDRALAPAALARLRIAALLVSLALLAVMTWRMVPAAIDTLTFGDLTSDLRIHFIWYWLPILVGSAAATLAVAAVIVQRRRLPPSAGEPAAQPGAGGI